MTEPVSTARTFSTRTLRVTLIAATVAGLASLLSACSQEPDKIIEEIRPVKVLSVEPKSEITVLAYSGSVKARREMNMGFRVAGKITERLVNIGDRVKKGDLLMRLDSTDLQLALARARATLDAASQQFETAQSAHRRAEQLYEQRTIAVSILEERKLALDQASAQKTSAQSALDENRNQLSYAELRADRDGVVTAVQADTGQVIGAGNVALVIANDGEKEVEIAVPEMDVSAFTPGQPVRARFWADTALTMTGKVREIAASADPVSRTFAIRVSLDNDPRVLLGMTATIEADRKGAAPSVTVPLSALSKQNGQTVVWLVDPETETVTAREVTASAFAGDGVEVRKGLSKGDLVVAAGTQFMTDKRKVRLPDGLKETLAANGTGKPAT